MVDLIPNTSTPSGQQTLVSATGFGNRFHCAADTDIDTISWHRRTSGDGAPASLDIWRVSTTLSVAHVAVSGDDGSTGWHNQTVSPAVTLLAGVDYIVGGNYAAGAVINYWATSPPSIGSGFTLVGARFGGGGAAAPSMPDSVSSVELAAMSVSTAPPPPPPTGGSDGSTGVGDPTLTGDLEAWLSDDPDLNKRHDDSAPYKTQALAVGGSGFDAIKAVADTIATSVGTGLRTAVTTLTTNLATANTALVHAATTWSDALASALQAMSDDFASFGASKPAQGGGDFGSGTFPSNVGTLVWTMLEETDFVGSIAWAQPADVYVLSITARPIGLPLNLTDGVHTIYRCGWWTPLNGSFARQRSYIDFEDSHLAIGAERMPGVLVSLLPGGEGHIQAWALT